MHRVATELYARNFYELFYNIIIKYLNIAYCMVNLNEYIWAFVQLLNPFIINASFSSSNYDEKIILNKFEQIKHCCQNFLTNRFSVPPKFFNTNDNKTNIFLSKVKHFILNKKNLFFSFF